jgi:hypothetical protein
MIQYLEVFVVEPAVCLRSLFLVATFLTNSIPFDFAEAFSTFGWLLLYWSMLVLILVIGYVCFAVARWHAIFKDRQSRESAACPSNRRRPEVPELPPQFRGCVHALGSTRVNAEKSQAAADKAMRKLCPFACASPASNFVATTSPRSRCALDEANQNSDLPQEAKYSFGLSPKSLESSRNFPENENAKKEHASPSSIMTLASLRHMARSPNSMAASPSNITSSPTSKALSPNSKTLSPSARTARSRSTWTVKKELSRLGSWGSDGQPVQSPRRGHKIAHADQNELSPAGLKNPPNSPRGGSRSPNALKRRGSSKKIVMLSAGVYQHLSILSEDKADTLDMDHVYAPLIDFIWVMVFVYPNVLWLLISGYARLRFQQWMIDSGQREAPNVDYPALVAELMLEAPSLVFLFRGMERQPNITRIVEDHFYKHFCMESRESYKYSFF